MNTNGSADFIVIPKTLHTRPKQYRLPFGLQAKCNVCKCWSQHFSIHFFSCMGHCMCVTMYKAFQNKRSTLVLRGTSSRDYTWTLVLLDSSFGHFRKTKIGWSPPLYSLGKLPSEPRVKSQLKVMKDVSWCLAGVYLICTFTEEPLNSNAIDKTSIHLHLAG